MNFYRVVIGVLRYIPKTMFVSSFSSSYTENIYQSDFLVVVFVE